MALVALVALVAVGWGNAAIARRLGISPKTVRNGVSTILAKLHAADRTDAIAQARDHGWVARRAHHPDTAMRTK